MFMFYVLIYNEIL